MYRPKPKIIMISTPPETPSHPFSMFAKKAEMEGAYIKLTIYDNPMVTEEMIEQYHKECLTETEWKREYLCLFVVDESRAIIPEWEAWMGETAVEHDEYFQFYDVYQSMDLGVVDNTVALFGYYDFKEATCVIENELIMSGTKMTTDLLAEALKAKQLETYGKDKEPYLRISDSDNMLLVQDLIANHGLPFHRTEKKKLHVMVNEVRMWVREGRVRIHPNCTFTRASLESGIWNVRKTEFERVEMFGHFDAIAALIYFIRNINEVRNPIPKMYNINPAHTHMTEEFIDKKSVNANAMKKAFKLNR